MHSAASGIHDNANHNTMLYVVIGRLYPLSCHNCVEWIWHGCLQSSASQFWFSVAARNTHAHANNTKMDNLGLKKCLFTQDIYGLFSENIFTKNLQKILIFQKVEEYIRRNQHFQRIHIAVLLKRLSLVILVCSAQISVAMTCVGERLLYL